MTTYTEPVVETFCCPECHRDISGSRGKYFTNGTQVCGECWLAPAIAAGNAASATVQCFVQNRSNADVIGRLDGSYGSAPSITREKANDYRKAINARRTEVRAHKRSIRSSREKKDIVSGGMIPSELFNDPTGAYGNEPGDPDIAKKLKNDGLAF